MVQEFMERFNIVLCHARNLDAVQKVELFVGGLPDDVRVDVVMRAAQDLLTMVYLAQAFELRAKNIMVMVPSGPQQLTRPFSPQ
jgi:hypothetical protein